MADTRHLMVYRDRVGQQGEMLCPRHRDLIFSRYPDAYAANEYGDACQYCEAGSHIVTVTRYVDGELRGTSPFMEALTRAELEEFLAFNYPDAFQRVPDARDDRYVVDIGEGITSEWRLH